MNPFVPPYEINFSDRRPSLTCNGFDAMSISSMSPEGEFLVQNWQKSHNESVNEPIWLPMVAFSHLDVHIDLLLLLQ